VVARGGVDCMVETFERRRRPLLSVRVRAWSAARVYWCVRVGVQPSWWRVFTNTTSTAEILKLSRTSRWTTTSPRPCGHRFATLSLPCARAGRAAWTPGTTCFRRTPAHRRPHVAVVVVVAPGALRRARTLSFARRTFSLFSYLRGRQGPGRGRSFWSLGATVAGGGRPRSVRYGPGGRGGAE